jgi:gliding motility-associated-like protein
LSATDIANPIAVYDDESLGGIRYKVLVNNEAGCVDSAFVTVKVFKTLPSVFVPTAFTPNGDGRNDVLRPIAVGIQRIDFFSIYNRLGQLVFSTAADGKGWDGTLGGTPQNSDVFVWMVKAVDYTGAPYFQKGTVTLIR